MKYTSLVQRLFQLNLFGGIKLGVNNCMEMSQALGHPERAFQSIHVAGSNGKGSVATKIACALQKEGYKVGLYTSPHIASFRERIKINGQMISQKDVEQRLTVLFALMEKKGVPCTFFEMTTLLAFLYFAEKKVDFAVLETGLGGRLDATNIVTPVLSIITSISLEHTEILGTQIEEIAYEKGGIIKHGIPILIGPRSPIEPLKKIAEEQNSPFHKVEGNYANFEEENRAIARSALELLRCPASSIELGLQALPPCRFEVVSTNPPVILDVAHNPDGLEHLFSMVRQHYPKGPLHIVFGLSKTKDISACAELLQQKASSTYLVEAPNGRGMPVASLKAELLQKGMSGKRIHIEPTIDASIRRAIHEARADEGIVIVCGSFFIMSEARQALGISEEHDPMDMNERTAKPNFL